MKSKGYPQPSLFGARWTFTSVRLAIGQLSCLCISGLAYELIEGQALADDPPDGDIESLCVGQPAIVEAVCLFVEIPEQVERLHAHIGSVQAALNEAPEVFQPVRVYLLANVLDSVIHNLMLVGAACGYPDLEELCSSNAFLVDTAHQYSVSRAASGEWERAIPLLGSLSIRDPNGFRPADPAIEITQGGRGPDPSDGIGWKVLGKEYYHRGDWITELIPRFSGDGKLALLAGTDKRKLPSRGVFFGGPVSDGAYGNVTLDVYEGGPEHEVAAVDLDCGMATLDCMAYVSIIDSRWFAVALQKDLTRAVLFDFGAQTKSEAK